MPSPFPLSFVSNKGPIETDKNDKLLTFIEIDKYVENADLTQPIEYKVIETIYNMDDDEMDSIDADNKNHNKLLKEDL